MQFLERGKEGKDQCSQRRDAEGAERAQRNPSPTSTKSRLAKSFICSTYARDRRKSFISTHIVNEGGGLASTMEYYHFERGAMLRGRK
jgi:hypothetical protein